jgi:hypothetical protein
MKQRRGKAFDRPRRIIERMEEGVVYKLAQDPTSLINCLELYGWVTAPGVSHLKVSHSKCVG